MPFTMNTSHAGEQDQQNVGSFIWPNLNRCPSFSPPLRLGVMASGEGSNFQALVEATRAGLLDATVECLVVNNPECGARKRAKNLGIQCMVHDHRKYQTRELLDIDLVETFNQAQVEGVIMAGWMRVVTESLISQFKGRLINIHPSLLPSFKGVNAIEQALESGVNLTGCSIHHVVPAVDSGRLLAQAAVPVLDGDDVNSLRERIQTQEHRILPMAIAIAATEWRK